MLIPLFSQAGGAETVYFFAENNDKTMNLRAPFENTDLETWGPADAVSLYLARCQVDTPRDLVAQVWARVMERRQKIDSVLDFGAGDGRFARGGTYKTYRGYEVDPKRWGAAHLPWNAKLIHGCAFKGRPEPASLCIGNPPYVRNQDLPDGWRLRAAKVVQRKTGVQVSGLANAWQYFFFLALASTRIDGLVALVLPYEWVSRPSSKAVREYIKNRGWHATVYRLPERSFSRVLTTASITLIDKSGRDGEWSYYDAAGKNIRRIRFPSSDRANVLAYESRRSSEYTVRACRGLSPGTQKVFVLTESERAELGLRIGRDVVRCVTSLRSLPTTCFTLTEAAFRKYYRDAGRRCWLISCAREPSFELRAYLDSVPTSKRSTATCRGRDVWWKFTMPSAPQVLLASGFRGKNTKAVTNPIKALAVGSVCGIHGLSAAAAVETARGIRGTEIASKVVAHSNGLRKLEINQVNTLLAVLGRT